jgi:acyl-CoA thioesterase FadM
MNLWFRLFLLIVSFIFRRHRIALPEGCSSRLYRVAPTDIDANLHMTNGRYPCFVDLSRLDFLVRTGMIRTAFKRDWRPMMLACKFRFRRELKPLQTFRVETRLRWWTDTSLVLENRFISQARDGSDILAAVSLERTAFYARKDKSFVPVEELFAAMELPRLSAPLPTPEILAFMQAEDEMRKAS